MACLFLIFPHPSLSQSGRPGPNFEARKHAAEYNGPGREDEPPAGLQEVRIGFFGPAGEAHAAGASVRQGVDLALEEANLDGGYRGLPFRLLASWSENPWGTGIGGLTRAVYYDHVWAIIGGIDGTTTHLAEQLAVKARLPLLSPVSSDKTANLANVPWIFSMSPGDHIIAPAIVDALLESARGGSFVLLSCTDHDAHMLFREVRRELYGRKTAPPHHLQFRSGAVDAGFVRRVLLVRPRAVAVLAGIEDSARMIAALRAEGFAGAIIGGPSASRTAFISAAGASAEGVLFPLLLEPGEAARAFVSRFAARYGRTPDYAAAHGYDAGRLLVEAVFRSGLNRARIADALRALSPWVGVSGAVSWDPVGQNVRPVRIGAIRDGRHQPPPACPQPSPAPR